jgi:hypothetical protein
MLKPNPSLVIDHNGTEFKKFYQGVLDYIDAGHFNADLIDSFLDTLEMQITSWLANPPLKPEHAIGAMRVILNGYLENQELYILRGKLSNLRGMIYKQGFFQIKPNLKQAEFCFKEAIAFGYQPAWENLGDLYFERASLNQMEVNNISIFNEAMIAYNNAGKNAKAKLVKNCYMALFKETLKLGNIDEAIANLNAIKKSLKGEKDNPDFKAVKSFVDSVPDLTKFKLSLEDAQRITAQSIISMTCPLARAVDTFLQVQNKLILDEENPIFDYYHARALYQFIKCLEKEKLLEEAGLYREQAKCLQQKIIDGHSYTDFMQPLVNFARGLGKEDDFNLFSQLPFSAKRYLTQSIKEGCYLAYSYLANIEQIDNPAASEALYKIGAETGDARCQISYFHRYIAYQLDHLTKDDIHAEINFCQQALNLLRKIIDNPFTLEENLEYFQFKYSEIEARLRENADYPKILTTTAWQEENEVDLNELLTLFEMYQTTHEKEYKVRLTILKKIETKATDLLTTDLPSTLKNKLEELVSKSGVAFEYINAAHYRVKLDRLAKQSLTHRTKHFTSFLKKRGRLAPQYYLEYIDPKHRKPELKQLWLASATTKNLFAWIKDNEEIKNLDKIEKVIYLSPDRLEQFQIIMHHDQAYYVASGKPVVEGKYLYAFSFTHELYIGEENNFQNQFEAFHHSSFFAGKPLLCAGEIIFKEGKAIHISNYSGHYIPSINVLYQTIISLRSKGYLDEDFTIGLVGCDIPTDCPFDLKKLTLTGFRLFYFGVNFLSLLKNKPTEKDEPEKFPEQSNDKKAKIEEGHEIILEIEQQIVNYLLAREKHEIKKQEVIKNALEYNHSFWSFTSYSIEINNSIRKVPYQIAQEYQLIVEAENTGDWLISSKHYN